ncbi:MAG: multicopper oxidase domain-containing protein [Gammaproteobacteria bacterium]|nr:multicopper oxidase domain-containing protein [Gammaproteobacteria bacterium]
MKINRRKFLVATAITPAMVLMSKHAFSDSQHRQELPIPELYEGEYQRGKKKFRLNVEHGEKEFFTGYKTSTLGYNGNYLGPTLKMKKGDQVAIEVNNHLSEDTTVHWHGMVLPSKMDGGPHQNITHQDKWISEFKVIQPAATLFYHSHAHGQTGQQVYRGLAGLLLIDDEESMQTNLPNEYGVDDIPIVIQDREFDQDGQFNYLGFMPERMIGKHGKTLLVNGAYLPVLTAKRTMTRLRLVNASNARFYNLGFDDGRIFQVVASDGGLLEQPKSLKRLEMGPGERYEILVDLSDRKTVMLKSYRGVGNAGHGPMRMMGMDIDMDVLLINAESVEKSIIKPTKESISLPDWMLMKNTSVAHQLELQMGMSGMMNRMGMPGVMMRINDESFDINHINFSVKKDQYEVWEISNSSPMAHPFHIHNTQFKVLSRNGKSAKPFEQGFKDTVIINQNEKVQVLVPTGPYSDSKNPYMYHCHILEHEDGGMMGQFLVTS